MATTPNYYSRNENGVLTPATIEGTDVTAALGLSASVETVAANIDAVPSLSSNVDTLSTSVATNTSDIASLSTKVDGLSDSTLSSEINSLSSQVTHNTSNISSLSSSVGTLNEQISTADSNISSLQSSVGTLNSSVSTNTNDISSISSEVGSLSTDVIDLQDDLKSIGDTQTLAGTTAGNVYYTQNQVGVQKKVVLNFDGYENNTATSQVITFPVPFTYLPIATSNINGLEFTITLTQITITAPNSTTVFNGAIIIDGQ